MIEEKARTYLGDKNFNDEYKQSEKRRELVR